MANEKVLPAPKSLKDDDLRTTFKRILLVGESGTGKTNFLGTMPKPFVADFDNGLETLVGKDVLYRTYAPDADGWVAFAQELDTWRKQGPQYGCETFALDSLSFAADAAMLYVLRKNGRAGQQPQIADWGDAIRQIKDVLGYLTTLPCHVAVTAHLQVEKDELLGGIIYAPLIYGAELPRKIPAWFGEVYITTVQTKLEQGQPKSLYVIQTAPDQRFKLVKTRMGRGGKFGLTEVPDFQSLVAKAAGPTK